MPVLPTEPVLTVLLFSCFAAACSALGAVPFAFGGGPPRSVIGAAYALASGLMLGAGYLLMTTALERMTLPAVLGAGAGVAYTYWTRTYLGIEHKEAEIGVRERAELGYQTILQNTLHSAAEGIAIGVAMVMVAGDLRPGIFLALVLAVHNVGEGMTMTELLRRRGLSVGESAGLCVVTNVTQPLLAVAAFALLPTLGNLLPIALGFAAGSLVFLVLTELVPESYERASTTMVATLMSVVTATVVLLEHVLL